MTLRSSDGATGQPRPSVLLVDDNPANRMALAAVLGSLDVDLVHAESGDEALRYLLDREFALVLMDIQMPGLDGFQTTELIRQRERTQQTPVIFVTAICTDENSARKASALGAVDFVTKPFDDAILRAKVAALTSHYRQRDIIQRQAAALKAKEREADREHAARRDAEASNRAKDQFLAVLSHELRAPLNVILGWSSLLRARDDVPSDVGRALRTITRSARAQADLIDDLLELSQLVAGVAQLDRAAVDLATTTQAALARMASVAEAKRTRIDLSTDGADHRVVGDAARLERLICALVSNAIKFSPDDATVAVDLSRSRDAVLVRVKDAGEGIVPSLLPRIFDRFHQGDGSWTRRHGGLGIGLAIARHIAELHGGTIEAFSSGEGSGAEFVFTVPAMSSTAAQSSLRAGATAEVPPIAMRPLDGVRVLLVDDDADARELLSAGLEMAGAAVTTVASAAAAVAAFEGTRFDAVLSDLGMPNEDGLSLMRKLRARDDGQSFRAIAISGYGSDGDKADSLAAGFDDHMTKPVDIARVMVALTQSVPAR